MLDVSGCCDLFLQHRLSAALRGCAVRSLGGCQQGHSVRSRKVEQQHWHHIAIKKVDGGSQRPRDRLDEGWGRHARRARPAHPSRSTSLSLARMSDRHAGSAAGRTEKRGPLTQGYCFFREGCEHRFIPASQRSHPQPAIHFLNRHIVIGGAYTICP
jgi:hypothetical protein